MTRVAILYANLGPFHIARLRRATEAMAAAKWELVCVELAGRQREYGWSPRGRPISGLDVRTLFPELDSAAVKLHHLVSRMRTVLRELRPDVVVVNGWAKPESWAAMSWAEAHGSAKVLVSDSRARGRGRLHWREQLKRGFASRLDAAFVAGTPHVRYLESLGFPASRCTLGCDVVDNALFRPKAARSTHGAEVRLLTCARLIWEKNLPDTVAALRDLDAPWCWTIVGEGPERARVEAAVLRAGLGGKITLAGRIDYADLPSMHERHDIYYQPSISDTWALAVNEAMAAGMPVLVSEQCGCHEDLVRNGFNGFTFDASDPAAIRGAVARIWEARECWQEMGEASLYLIKDWDLDRFASGLYDACEIALQHVAERRRGSWMGRAMKWL